MKLWGGRFTKDTDQLVEKFSASIHFDHCLWKVDILGSLAHVKALEKADILTTNEAQTISNGLQLISKKIIAGEVEFSLSDEDIHMNIERLLYDEIGSVAGKLHTGRSRNDQVALDMHLYLREQLLTMISNIQQLQQAIILQADQHIDTILPGYTHLQHAQPVRFAHHLLAYAAMLQRDADRLIDSWARINTLPLGAGAIAGSGFNIDRDYIASLLQFDAIYENSMDAVSDRDFVAEFLAHTAIIMMHLSRLSEEIILWSTQEFSFIELDDAFCTGSSMMPQKKNPDVAELVRGKTGRVYGALTSVLTMLKGLPLAYNKDMQEDKECLFDAINTVNHSLTIYASMLATMKVNKDRMLTHVTNKFSCATALADFLVKKNLPFREAHKVIGNIVNHCVHNNLSLSEISLTQFKLFSPLFDEEVYQLLQPENAIETCKVKGGTAKHAVISQIQSVNSKITSTKKWLASVQAKIAKLL
jgi:argininosuccinate lyase